MASTEELLEVLGVTVTPPERSEFANRIDTAIETNLDDIAKLSAKRRVSVLVSAPTEDQKDALRSLGWDGEAAVFYMKPRTVAVLSADCRERGDEVTPRWLARRRTRGRIFLWIEGTEILLNFTSNGWKLEPREET